MFTHASSRVHSPVQRAPVLPHLQFPVQDLSRLQCRMMEQALLTSSNVVQYGKQHAIVFLLSPALPEIRVLLMIGGCLVPVKAGLKRCMFKQSCSRGWDVLQSILPLVKKTMPGFIDLSQTTSFTIHDDHKSFPLLHMERLEHDVSLVSASNVSVNPGVFCQYAQAVFLPRPRKCDVV